MTTMDWQPIILAFIGGLPAMLFAAAAFVKAVKGNNQNEALKADNQVLQAKIEKVNGDLLRFIQAATDTAEVKGRVDGLAEGLKTGTALTAPSTIVIPGRRKEDGS